MTLGKSPFKSQLVLLLALGLDRNMGPYFAFLDCQVISQSFIDKTNLKDCIVLFLATMKTSFFPHLPAAGYCAAPRVICITVKAFCCTSAVVQSQTVYSFYFRK